MTVKIKILNNKQKLSEANLSRILTDYMDMGFIIISADRTCSGEKKRLNDEAKERGEEIPYPDPDNCTKEELDWQAEENVDNEEELRQMIRRSGFGYVPTWGGFKEKVTDPETGELIEKDTVRPEASFIVASVEAGSPTRRLDYGKLKDMGIFLARKYNQDSFLYKPPNDKDTNAYFINGKGTIDMKFSGPLEINDLMQEYYTQMRKDPEKRFSFTEVFINKPPSGMSEAVKRYGEKFFRLES